MGAHKIDQVSIVFSQKGFKAVLSRKPRRWVYDRILGYDTEAHLIASSCRKPLEKREPWTL
ncbi:MAG: hypothetical protein ACTXOO_03645 [Sodalis sp. (in: enterobacteria)]